MARFKRFKDCMKVTALASTFVFTWACASAQAAPATAPKPAAAPPATAPAAPTTPTVPAATAPGPAADPAAAADTAPLPPPSSAAQHLYASAKNDILQVRSLLKSGRTQSSVGSGFLIGTSNLVVTN